MNTITIDHLNEALNAATPQADGKYSVVDVFNAAQKLAEQSAQPEPVPFPLPEHERAKLKAQQAKSESVDPHAALRAEYIRQRDSVPCERWFYKWEFQNSLDDNWLNCGSTPEFCKERKYHYTDISCYVSKDGEPAIRMLRTDAQALHNTLGNSVIWYDTAGKAIREDLGWEWAGKGTYTYRTKQPKIVKWADVPVGVTVINKITAVKFISLGEDFQFKGMLRLFNAKSNTLALNFSELELAPADQQPWIVMTKAQKQKLTDLGFTFEFGATNVRDVVLVQITGLQDGYKIEGNV